MNVGFQFTRIVVIESLEPHEVKTGAQLVPYLKGLCEQLGYEISVDYIECESKIEFLAVIKNLVAGAVDHGQIPLLHVETHGHPNTGLEFANGSELSWEALSAALLELNVACRFNLFAAFAACYGAFFLSQMNVIRPAPCYAIVAPTDTIDPGELMGGFLRFYGSFFRCLDMGIASSQLSNEGLSSGRWLGQTAERWYETILLNYATTYSTRPAMQKRAREVSELLLKAGIRLSIGQLKPLLRDHNRSFFDERGFAVYFSTDLLPENRVRFDPIRRHVASQLDVLRAQPQYLL